MPDYSKIIAERYPELLGLMIDLVNAKAGQPIPAGQAWRNDAQTLAMKLFKHLVSMHNLSGGSTITTNGVVLQHVDHGSIIVIARAALETYLVWHYLYGSGNPELSRFRYLTWKLGGLMDRQKLQAISSQNREIQSMDLPEIVSLQQQIASMPQSKGYSPNQIKGILKGDWKAAMGMSNLAAAAGFHGRYFSNTYNYLCGYSHASYISAMQTGQATFIEDQRRLSRTIMGIGMVTMAHFVCKYPKVFPDTLHVLDQQAELKKLAELFALSADDMSSVYVQEPQ